MKLLDEILNENLVIIGGRPAMGKTTLAYNLLVSNMSNKTYGAYFSRENDSVRIIESLKSILGKKDIDMYISDELLTLEEQFIEIKVLKKVNPKLNLVVLDYLQLYSENSEKVIDKLKILSTTLGITIVVLSMLTRSIETRSNKRPRIEDLRLKTLSSIDKVYLMYREDYYEAEASNDKYSIQELVTPKGESLLLKFDKKTHRITDYK